MATIGVSAGLTHQDLSPWRVDGSLLPCPPMVFPLCGCTLGLSLWAKCPLLISTFIIRVGPTLMQHDLVLTSYIYSQFSHSVVSDSLQPHGLQHARLPVHHQLLEFAPLSW